ncbi:hypothetical protein B5G52_17055 [Pseudoalteromonas sp. A601]|nr:hypothetical protein B5G52_17055 [Pseudoalteromonas sp. A601]
MSPIMNNLRELLLTFTAGNKNIKSFCDDFYRLHDLGEDQTEYSEEFSEQLDSLSELTGRFSDVEEDLAKYPSVYISERELVEKINKVKDFLNLEEG